MPNLFGRVAVNTCTVSFRPSGYEVDDFYMAEKMKSHAYFVEREPLKSCDGCGGPPQDHFEYKCSWCGRAR